MQKKTLLLFGASGRIGQVIARRAAEQGFSLLTPTHAECPMEDAERVSDLVLGCGAQVVINAAAMSRLEACEDDPLLAHRVNALAPAAMALACRHTGARFLHLSTDYVLEGHRKGLKDESTRCKPLNLYGESKREAEFAIAEAFAESLILRVSWVCGNPKKPGFLEQILARALAGEALAAIDDQFSLPTDAEDVARVLLLLAETDARGVFQLCSGGEPMSRWDCATLALQEAVRLGLLPAAPPIARQKLKSVPFFRAPRPQHTAMNNAKLRSLGIPLPKAEEAIAAMVRRYGEKTNEDLSN